MKRPSFQFYPGDWRRDPALAACSLAARGLWIEMMCIAHESAEYGVLAINGSAMSPPQLARVVGEAPAAVARLIAELESAGVFSRDAKGAIFSRRMVKDEGVRNNRGAGGEAGKEFGVLGAEHGKKGGRPKKETGVNKPPFETPLKPPPSSSSSSSSSSSEKKEEAELPLDFALPDWIPEAAWNGYVDMRKKQRKPMTDRARDLKVAELQRFRDAGHDVGAILDKSTANSWTDVYAPKPGDVVPFEQPRRNSI